MKDKRRPSPARKWVAALLGGLEMLSVGLVGQPASAQSAIRGLVGEPALGARDADDRYVDTGDRFLVVPRRAPRELFARSQVGRTVQRLVQLDPSVLGSASPDASGAGAGTNQGSFMSSKQPITVAGIRLGTGTSPMLLGKRYLPDARCDAPQKCATDKNAATEGYSLGGVSSVGWIVGAVNVGLGAFLLLTHDRKAGAETSIGADVYNGGGGLKFRRSVW